MDDQHRRHDDSYKELAVRLEQLERGYATLNATVMHLGTSVDVVKLEQGHIKEIFDARLRVIEKNQEIHMSKFDTFAQSILTMLNQVDQSPAGRMLRAEIYGMQQVVTGQVQTLHATIDEHTDRLDKNFAAHAEITEWRNRIDGVLYIMKWIGAGGLVALGITVLRLLKILP